MYLAKEFQTLRLGDTLPSWPGIETEELAPVAEAMSAAAGSPPRPR